MGLSGLRNVVAESAIEFINQSKALETVQDVLKSVIGWWRGLSDNTKQTIMTVVAGVAAFGGLLLALSALAAVLPAIAAGFALLTGPVGLVIAGVGLLSAAYFALRTEQDAALKAARQAEKQSTANLSAIREQITSLEEMSRKTKLTGADEANLAKIKEDVAKRAIAAGQAIDVQRMSLEELMSKMKEFEGMEKTKSIMSLTQQYTELSKAQFQSKVRLDALAVQYKNATPEAYTAALNKELAVYKGLETEMNLVTSRVKDLTKEKKKSSAAPFKWTGDKPPEKALASLDSFNDALAKYSARNAATLEEEQKAVKEYQKAYTDGLGGIRNALATAGLAEAAAKVAQQVIAPFGQLTDAISKGIEYDSQVALRDLDVVSNRAAEAYKANREALEMQEAEKIKALEKSFDEQIRVLTEGENAKNQAAQRAADERLLIANDEYERAKAAAEEKFRADIERDQMEYEAKMALLEERALDREQRQLTEPEGC